MRRKVYESGSWIADTVFERNLGSACVFFLRDELHRLVQKGLLGFASGVMVAASVWSLLIPSIELAESDMGRLSFLPAAVGAMIYVVVEELLPEANEGAHSNISTLGFAAGFLVMMILDVALG